MTGPGFIVSGMSFYLFVSSAYTVGAVAAEMRLIDWTPTSRIDCVSIRRHGASARRFEENKVHEGRIRIYADIPAPARNGAIRPRSGRH
jgi:hypothetical protein